MQVGKDLNTETNCTVERQTFSIENSPIAFEILSTRLYANPKMAIVRELLTNAYDAHVEAGTLDIPIDVTLPNYYDATLTIRDHGTGLSEEDIFGMYSTFFASNKRDSNKLTGGFGLGSKTPFAYTSSFIVCSYYKGIKSTYAVTKIDGFPNIMKMMSGETEEDNGLEIKIPIMENDVYSFSNAVDTYLKYIPEIKVNINLTLTKVEPFVKIKNIAFYDHSSYHPIVYIKQGQNVFPVEDGYHNMSQLVVNTVIVIEVPIGTLEITPSREGLHYTPTTIAAIKEIISPIHDIVMNLAANDSDARFLNSDIRTRLKNKEFAKQILSNPKIAPYLTGITENTLLFTRYGSTEPATRTLISSVVDMLATTRYTKSLTVVDPNIIGERPLVVIDYTGERKKLVSNVVRWNQNDIIYVTAKNTSTISKRHFIGIIYFIKELNKFLGKEDLKITTAYQFTKDYEEVDMNPLEAREKSILYISTWTGYYLLGNVAKYQRGTLRDAVLRCTKYNLFPLIMTQETAHKLGGTLTSVLQSNLSNDSSLKEALNTYFNEINNTSDVQSNYFGTSYSPNIVIVKNSNKRLAEKAYGITCVSYESVIAIIKEHVKPIIYPIDMREFSKHTIDYTTLLKNLSGKEKTILFNAPKYRRIELYQNMCNQMQYAHIINQIYDEKEITVHPTSLRPTLKRLSLLFASPVTYNKSKRINRLEFLKKLIQPMDYREIVIDGE